MISNMIYKRSYKIKYILLLLALSIVLYGCNLKDESTNKELNQSKSADNNNHKVEYVEKSDVELSVNESIESGELAELPEDSLLSNVDEVTSFILNADHLRHRINRSFSGEIIGEVNRTEVYKLEGKYGNKTEVLSLLESRFSGDAINIELRKKNLAIVNDYVGFIGATGGDSYKLTDESHFELLINEVDFKQVKARYYDEFGDSIDVYYVIQKIEDKWKITKELNLYSYLDCISVAERWANTSSSSSLSSNSFNYEPSNVLDSNINSAWVEGNIGSGIGEWIKFKADDEERISLIQIRNGYAKSEQIFSENGRVRVAHIEFSNGEVIQIELDDSMLIQSFSLEKSVLTESVKITIVEEYEGNKYQDTCISEVKIY